jgi:hypothetical protein
MNTINELDAVALTCDQPEHGLVRGDVGTAVLVHGGEPQSCQVSAFHSIDS